MRRTYSGLRYLNVPSIITVDTTPLLKDLYQHITPQYAADWKVIGTLLGLPSGRLQAIEAGWPTNVKWCCNQMLEKWLQVDTTASWRKLITIIKSPAVSYSALNKGDKLVCNDNNCYFHILISLIQQSTLVCPDCSIRE